ncbi:response regulator transcription factor [Marivirga sp. S37H4]|uniref:Response regulator transcription factor n=1 Tax=Marivirga aurantiaca TaxID=2802615 RepID=A0A934WYR6_9BACT|nr:response regulator transcription factor [Marivirga aurantiaca]MBK6265658.1 response regulator transcription factor [Marivirga aurantiaca]
MDRKVSCIIVDDEPTAREILLNHLSKIEQVKVVGSCSSAVEAFNLISTHQVDLIFLDINMPEISGLSFAKSINKDLKIIFTTAYREYAIEGFDLQAVDYLLKPISFERLFKSVNLYFDVYHSKEAPVKENTMLSSNDFMFVKADRKMVKIDHSDIIYIESFSDYLKIHTKSNTVITRETISNIEAKLPTENFIRVHRSFIISIPHIISYTNEYVEVKGSTIPIGRTHKSFVLERLERN